MGLLPKALRSQADAWITANLPLVIVAQTTNRDSKPRFHQCLDSHTTPPAGNAPPDRRRNRTGDNGEGWDNLGASAMLEGVPVPLSASITSYGGPLGEGWELVAQTFDSGTRYHKVVGRGPEAQFRDHDWQEIVPAPGRIVPKSGTRRRVPARRSGLSGGSR